VPEKPTWAELNLRLAACLPGGAEAHARRLAVIENDPAERAQAADLRAAGQAVHLASCHHTDRLISFGKD
jgi:mono/diheme cytochrome c family protein